MTLFIIGPYRAPTWDEVHQNIMRAADVACRLWDAGHVVICPHTNTAHFEMRCQLTDEQWLAGIRRLLGLCQGAVVLPGFSDSSGSIAEIAMAERIGIPLYYWPDMPATSDCGLRLIPAKKPGACLTVASSGTRDWMPH